MASDHGLFGPDSITWRVHADPSMSVGGFRALYLQALHPLAMAGVDQHSDYQTDPWGRLQRTGEWIGLTTYGTLAEIEPAAERLRRLHERVQGIDKTTGEAYRASDPELLLWVHCCAVDSFLSTYRRCGGSLAAGDGDRYVAEQVRVAPLVGLDPALVPDTEKALAAYFQQVRPRLRLTPAARTAQRFSLTPPMPTPARPAWVGVVTLSFAMLPRWARVMYAPFGLALPDLPGQELATSTAGRALRAALLALPADRREGPHLKAARARLDAAA